MTTFEVRDEEQGCHLIATLRDISKDQCQVQLGSSESATRWIRWDAVRNPPTRPTNFGVQAGSKVEVLGEEDDGTWWDAEVQQVKGGFYKVKFRNGQTGIAEIERIRPPTPASAAVKQAPYVKQVYPVSNAKLHSWFLQNEGTIAQDVSAKSHLVSLRVHKKNAQIVLIGAPKAITTARMLLDLHAKHLGDIQRVHNEREQLTTKLESEKSKLQHGVRIEFAIGRDLIGLVVGKGGKNISDVQKQTGVDRIEVDPNPAGPRVVVIGPTT
jgi:hypothetical protein